ncbi:hypothetical protein BJ912DRAFT_958117 [Pholiota molesta]|nr:hypothetical protein BJ912DRAFT_958117 [Pholiota molesta]
MLHIVKKVKTTRNSSDNETPECNIPATSRCDPEKGDTCGACKEGISLDRQILEMEEALSTLKAKRAANNTKVNTVHGSLSRLPIELVSDIFMYLRPLPMELGDPFFPGKADDVAENMKTLLLLGAVCRAWRSLAWSFPQLWTTISVNLYDEHENAPDMINQWLDRSDELPLHIYLYTACRRLDSGLLAPHPYGYESYIGRLTYPINQCSERWFYLNLNLPKRFMQYVYCNELDAPMLVTFTVQLVVEDIEDPFIDNEDPADCINLWGTPNLREVNLYALTFDDVAMEWDSVTHVHVFRLLRAAPRLTHLTLENLGADVFELPILTCLQINGHHWAQGADVFLAYFDFPALENLSTFANSSSKLDNLDVFLRSSSCTLKKFQLNICGSWMENKQQLIHVLDKMPLPIHQHKADEPPLSQLPHRPKFNNASIDERLFLPNLKKVHIKLRCAQWSCSLDLLLHPDDSNIVSARRSDDNHTIPSVPPHFDPLLIYFLLDPGTQQTMQPVIERAAGHATIFRGSRHDFLRRSLQCYVYDLGDLSSS